jgi:SHS2 domain-containing protein
MMPTPPSPPPPIAGFEEVEHTADWAYRIWAPDPPQLFLQAARGLYALVGAKFAPSTTPYSVTLQGVDYESLLVAWLNELLHFHDSQNLGFDPIDITHLTPTVLEATLEGAPLLQWQKDIKAATYHNLAIAPTPTGLEATIVLDV